MAIFNNSFFQTYSNFFEKIESCCCSSSIMYIVVGLRFSLRRPILITNSLSFIPPCSTPIQFQHTESEYTGIACGISLEYPIIAILLYFFPIFSVTVEQILVLIFHYLKLLKSLSQRKQQSSLFHLKHQLFFKFL